jgi:predicted nucleotidyltransferase
VQVFGSVAREEASSDSDVDFLVDVGSNHSRWFPAGLLADARRFVGL